MDITLYMVFDILQKLLIFLCGYSVGRRRGYKEGVDMCMGEISTTVEAEMKKQLIGKMEMFSQNIKEAAYELRQVNKEREGMEEEKA